MSKFLTGMTAIGIVLVFAVGGSVWLASSVRDNDPVAFVVGTGMFLLAIAFTYVVGEALEQYKP